MENETTPAPIKIFWNNQEFTGQDAINIICDRLERLELGGGLSSNDVSAIAGSIRAHEDRMRQLEAQAAAIAGGMAQLQSTINQVVQTVNFHASDIARLGYQMGQGPAAPGPQRAIATAPAPAPAPAPATEEPTPAPFSVCPLCTAAPGYFTQNAEEFNEHMRAGNHNQGS